MIEINNTTAFAIDKTLILKIAKAVLVKENPPKARRAFRRADISIALVNPRRARQLNMTYRKKHYVPNVLSFDYGEIVLCPEKIRQDAKKYGILFERELARVFMHGLLHLLGYSHAQMKKFKTNFRT